MNPETGESSASINKRDDDEAWPNILAALREGGHLHLHRKISRGVLEDLGDEHPALAGRRTMSISRVRRLNRDGVLIEIGIDRYALPEGFDDLKSSS